MASYTDNNPLLSDETWFTSGQNLFNFINAEEYMTAIEPQHTEIIYQQTPLNQHNHQHRSQLNLVECKPQFDYCARESSKSPQLDGILPYPIETYTREGFQLDENQYHQEDYRQAVAIFEVGPQQIGPPPLLAPKMLARRDYSVQEHLDYRKALAAERYDQYKTRLEHEPLQMPSKILKKPDGKKMTGRERQQELERQEAEELRRRDRYVSMITSLEEKNNRLRQMLMDIVNRSPDINREIIDFLNEESSFIDSHIEGRPN